MKVMFRNIKDTERFCKAAEKYDGNITISNGSIEVDASSIVSVVQLGYNKLLDVHIADTTSASAMELMSTIAKLGIERS